MPEQPRVVIAGASGFIGPALIRSFARDGYDVRTMVGAAPMPHGKIRPRSLPS